MKITLTQNKFNPNPYYDQRIKAILSDNFVKNLPGTIDTFDQNGFDLTNLERLYAKKMDYKIKKVRIYPQKSKSLNLAFDVTPAKLVTGLITEKGICEASEKGLKGLFK